MRVLVVDDEKDIRQIIRLLLESRGYEVIEAQDGAAAVSLLGEDRGVDLVIMDIMMPRMSGVEATAKIREFSTVPVIASGGAGSEEDFVKLFRTLPKVDAGLAASIFHFGEVTISHLKETLKDNGIPVRIM